MQAVVRVWEAGGRSRSAVHGLSIALSTVCAHVAAVGGNVHSQIRLVRVRDVFRNPPPPAGFARTRTCGPQVIAGAASRRSAGARGLYWQWAAQWPRRGFSGRCGAC